MRKYIEENRKILRLLMPVIFFVLVIGVVTGSVFYIKSGGEREVINAKIGEAFLTLSKSQGNVEIMRGYFAENAVWCAVIFISSYFKLGALISAAAVLRKGFVTGFTSAAAAGTYGIAGTALMSSTVIDLVLSSVILIMLSAISISHSLAAEKKSKKFLIFFTIFSISIFCVLSFSRGFLTTTFMKMVYPKII